jgi:hypothetical protein
MSLLPPDADLDLIHTRHYEAKVYRVDDHMVVRGAVRDTKRPGLYIEDDPDPIDIHHMVLELAVSVPDLTITAVSLDFESYPTTVCPSITESYQQLVGLSIARGFTHKVRELFGGPRGCTHVVALLQAMAPAVVQATWSLTLIEGRRRADAGEVGDDPRTGKFGGNVNTCHVWAEDGEHVALVRRGERPGPPLQVSERLVQLGRDPESWRGL